jgi:hypothetical protein
MADNRKQSTFSLADRLDHGVLTVKETRELARVSHTKFYEDAKNGLVTIEKRGRSSFIRGPIATAYIAGRPISEVA